MELPKKLRSDPPEKWNAIDIDFHPPHIERLWQSWRDEYRLNLHFIHHCVSHTALYHPHAWPAAIRVVKGRYGMVTGYGAGDIPPPYSFSFVLPKGAYYEMVDPDAWHAEYPFSATALTVSLSGKPWPRKAPKSPHPLSGIKIERRVEILKMFAGFYR